MGAPLGHLCSDLISVRPRTLDDLEETGRAGLVQASKVFPYSAGLIPILGVLRGANSLGIHALVVYYFRSTTGGS